MSKVTLDFNKPPKILEQGINVTTIHLEEVREYFRERCDIIIDITTKWDKELSRYYFLPRVLYKDEVLYDTEIGFYNYKQALILGINKAFEASIH